MNLLYIESINKDNSDDNELLRVISGNGYSTNDEFKATVTIDMTDIKETLLYETELVVHGECLGKSISLPIKEICMNEGTKTTHTCTIFADFTPFDKNLSGIADRYKAQFATTSDDR